MPLNSRKNAVCVTHSSTRTDVLYQFYNLVAINYITCTYVSEETAIDIAAALSYNTNLQMLYLRRNSLQAAGAIKVAKSLLNFSNLKKLDLAYNNISEEAADDITALFIS